MHFRHSSLYLAHFMLFFFSGEEQKEIYFFSTSGLFYTVASVLPLLLFSILHVLVLCFRCY